MSIASEITRLLTAKANLKTAIEGKGVTVPSATTLDGYATLVSSISGGGSGGNAQSETGTFTGSGNSSSVTINIGFEPDVVIVIPEMNVNEAGWRGSGYIFIVKNEVTVLLAHTSDTSTSASIYYDKIASGDDPYGADTSKAYTPYGTYSNGSMTLANKTSNANTYFVNNKQYTWVAFKKNTPV